MLSDALVIVNDTAGRVHAPCTERAPPLERDLRSRPTQANLNQTATARRLPAQEGKDESRLTNT